MKSKIISILCLMIMVCCMFQTQVFANTNDLDIKAKSAILIDAKSGDVLFDKMSDERLQVASIVKLMTVLLTIEEIESGNLNLNDYLIASSNASGMGGSQVFIDANAKYTIEEMLKSVIVASANDASVALAEHISGNEKAFVEKMNSKAKELGLKNTLYANSTGLPAPMQYSTAHDTAILLGCVCQKDIYHNYSKIWIDKLVHNNGRETEIVNTNKLIRYYQGCNGGKTGFTDEAGYCLSASAEKDSMHLIGVVLGTSQKNLRFNETVKLFNYGFSNFVNNEILNTHDKVGDIAVLLSNKTSVGVFAKENYSVLTKKGEKSNYRVELEMQKNIKAPAQKGCVVGKAIVYKNQEKVKEIDIIVAENVDKLTFKQGFDKIIQKF